MAADEPYGDVKYADPGYQDDGKKRYPLDSEAHCRAAWSYINQADSAGMYSAEHLKAIRSRIMAAGKKYGIEFADEAERSVRMYAAEILRYDRTWALEDITIQRGGGGRTVEAYAAIWDTPAEVKDQHGHYMEVISRGAFDKTIKERGSKPIPVYFNHGMTAAGTPSDAYSVPIGRSLEVRAESRGLWTLSRYNDGPDADRVLEAIRNGAITAQSFRGKVYKSSKGGTPRGGLPTITRTELGLAEYGPTASAVYEGAAILALRSQAALASLLAQGYDLDQLIELARTSTTPQEPETHATSAEEAGADEPPATAEHSGRTQADIARKIKRARILWENIDEPEEA